MDSLAEKFNLARRELLDLSLKNPLLNFRLKKGMGLEFKTINPSDLFDYLVNENKNVFFTRDDSNSFNKIKVDLDDKEFRKRITKTYRTRKMYLEEKGANILFLALGFLKWNENEDSQEFFRAPLILIPIEIVKQDNVDRYFISYTEEEIRYNISLITKLQSEFGIDIEFDKDEDIKNIDKYFRYVDEQIAKSTHSSWEVEIYSGAIDFFSYAKFLMYQDLDLSKWLDKKKKFNSPLMRKLFVTNFDDKLDKDIDINKIDDPLELVNIVDADSSQAEVIYYINKGVNMVIQGPPGTGKSQTISNIIASSITQGKSILFIAEKKAALDVVQRRLVNVGLGDLVLELHSQMTNKKEVLRSIERTLLLGDIKLDDNEQLNRRYEEIKDQLNDYKNLVNQQIDAHSNVSLNTIYGRSLEVKERLDEASIRMPRLSLKDIESWDEDEFQSRLEMTKEYADTLKTIGKIEKHPLYGIGLTACQPYEQVSIKEKLNDLEDALNNCINAFNEIASIFNNKTCNTLFETGRYIKSIDAVIKYKKLGSINCMDPTIFEDKERILDLINKSKQVQNFIFENGDYFVEDAFNRTKEFIELYFSYSSLSYFKKKKAKDIYSKLLNYLKEEKKVKERLNNFYLISKDIEELKQNDSYLKYLFPTIYQGIKDTPWGEVTRNIDLSKEFLDLIYSYKIIPQSRQVIQDEEKVDRLLELKESFLEQKNNFVDKLNDYLSLVKFDDVKKFSYHSWYLDLTFSELKRTVSIWKNNIDSILEITRYNDLQEKFKNLGMEDLLDYASSISKVEYLGDVLSLEYYQTVIKRVYKEHPELDSIKKFRMDRNVDLFKELDSKMKIENIKTILKYHYDHMPKINDTTKDMNVIRRELQKKRNQMPIRKLISKTGETLKKIKPVFMMSPISVANFLDPNCISFDLVIFDEASQVRPVEAFGAILRAKQIVVVGDSKQLPPTTFFDVMTNKIEDVDDEDLDITNMESILSLLLSKNIIQKTLSWHYRSRHQSLINISNNEFYDHELKVFPSINERDPSKGLVFNYLPKGSYDRGGTRTNKYEAKEVIKQVMEHAKNHPEMSLGVASFSLAQQEELYKEFENQLKRITDPEIRDFFSSKHKDEPFFIKNLESVQGDERDCIFISIGYGYDKEGNITMDFGPLNKEGGERRLNVLTTRAKLKCVVFSNITSHDINLSKTSSKGVAALKRYLEYAQNRVIFKTRTLDYSLDEFTAYLYDKLSEYGYDLDTSIGHDVGIDIAIYDKNLGCYTLGIECDGGGYKTLESTIDRERIRRDVLKSLGWKLYHIYVPEFYRNLKGELEKLLNYISDIKKEAQSEKEENKPLVIERKKNEILEDDDTLCDYVIYTGMKRRMQILQDKEGLTSLINKILEKEAPVHVNILKRRLQEITSGGRITQDAEALIDEIILENQDYSYIDSFIIPKGSLKISIRNRSKLDNAERKVEYIPDIEIEEAIKCCLRRGEAGNENELNRQISEYFGFNKSKKLEERIKSILLAMINNNIVYLDDDVLYLSDEIA